MFGEPGVCTKHIGPTPPVRVQCARYHSRLAADNRRLVRYAYSRIWALLRLLPFGGLLAMMLSFGSLLMPTSFEEYRGGNGKHSAASHKPPDQQTVEDQQYELSRMIRDKVRRQTKMTLPLRTTLAGLCAMYILLAGVSVAIVIIAVGSVYPQSCIGIWWFPTWYLVGMFAFISPTYVSNHLNT